MEDSLYSREQLYNNMGVQRKKSLFFEECYDDPKDCVFTLKEYDHEGYASLYKLFMKYTTEDPSEYVFALAVFGSWSTWENLSSSPVLKKHLPRWRNEVQVRNRSLALIEVAKSAPSNFQAAKYLLEQEMLTEDGKNSYQELSKSKSLKGKKKTDALAEASKAVDEDAARILHLSLKS
tara:strand:+ start:5056 stop:5589 length:534 start_codon:yes stop_codon:yes gene_type:complete